MRCRCCGIEPGGRVPFIPVRPDVCVICAQVCDGDHAERLQRKIWRKLSAGMIDVWHAIAASLLDDALITGQLTIIPPHKDAREPGALLWCECPPRWLVEIGRCAARGELVAIGDVVNAVMAKHMKRPNTQAVRNELALDMREALLAIDRDVIEVEVNVTTDALDPQHIQLVIKKRVNVEPGAVVVPGAANVEIPPDMLTRARAKA